MGMDSAFYKDILDNMLEGVYFVDTNRVITYWNRGAERITGYFAKDVTGRSCRQTMLNHVSASGEELCEGKCPLMACIEDGSPREAEMYVHHADGHRLPVAIRVAPMVDEHGMVIGAVETFTTNLRDTGILRQELRRLRRSLRMDPLTGIGNRHYLEGRLRGTLTEVQGTVPLSAGILFIDIDGFKPINDTWGHQVGDRVLCMVAASIRHSLRQSDSVGRWGGEEFVVIVEDVYTPEDLHAVADKARIAIQSSRLDLDDWSLSVTASIGATLLCPTDTHESAIGRADSLMYQSKSGGRNRVTVG